MGRVRSVHRAAVHVDLEGPDGLLVLAVDDVGGIPCGILVAGVTDLRRSGIRAGMRFTASADGWSIPGAGVGIKRSHAVPWSPMLPAAAMLRLTPELAGRVPAARRLAAERAPEGGLGPLLSGRDRPGDPWLARARTLIRAQLDALARGDVGAAVGPTVGLIGLGVGLTPSGDDYLVGLLAVLGATADPTRHELAAAVAAHAPARTTAAGAAALVHAARGEFAERMHDLLIALAAGRSDRLASSIERAMAYGSTSGGDTLVGVFAALDHVLDHALAGRAQAGSAVA